jgi:glucokinase
MSEGPPLTPRNQAQAPFFIGIDLGGTSIKIGLVDDQGKTFGWTRVMTEVEQGPDAAVERMGRAIHKLIAESGLPAGDVKAIGLATPGTMDIPAGKFLDPVNLPGWSNYPIRDRVSAATGKPVSYVNDANAAAYGEFWIGGAAQFHSMVFLTLGTGVGGGIIIGDVNVEGEHSHGSELGHIIIDYNDTARMCSCGQRGHLEAYASATAVAKRAQEAIDAGRKSSIAARVNAGEELTPLMLHQEAEKGDAFALEVIMETAMFLGVGVVTFMHTVDPDAIILGGAMTFGEHQNEIGRRFLERVKEEVVRRAFPIPAEKTLIDYAKLGAHAGYVGAAGIARLAARGAAR